ncbi:hypothetical protein [Kingella potus]|uniref:hypothetical protein n=1 Tax=Kingella potus TaxID=265175 RepID=UPI001FD13F19|nr:hypothetical protein [Kingella potus]UOO99881.1 hypothetical protein LVJ84_07295 [Kingella potus]
MYRGRLKKHMLRFQTAFGVCAECMALRRVWLWFAARRGFAVAGNACVALGDTLLLGQAV